MPKSISVKLDLRTAADFYLEVPVRRKQVVAGTDAVYTVTSDALTGYTDDVDLSVTGLPTGASATIGSDPIGNDGSTTITVETTGTSAGVYDFTIGGTVYTPPEDIYYAASAELEDVLATIALASPGDTVRIPANAPNWEVWPTHFDITKGVAIKGAGIGLTQIKSGYAGAGMSSMGNSDNYLVHYAPSSPSSNDPFGISGISWDFDNKCWGIYLENTSVIYPISRVRVHHNNFINQYGGTSVIYYYGTIFGCVDNNEFTGGWTMLDSTGLNATTWGALNFSYGTYENMYYEDNVINYTDEVLESGNGSRFCFRHNIFNNIGASNISPLLDMHGNDPAAGHSGMGVEIYSNVVNNNGKNVKFFYIRGGKGIVFDNDINNAGSVTGSFDEEHPDSDNPPATSPNGQPQYISASYVWMNRKGGATILGDANFPYIGATVDYGGEVGIVPRIGVHFWKHASPFTGASGEVGVGLLSARPSSGLSIGIGYWATDESKLYRATGATTWELFYMPYTYPHPLRSDPVLGD